jgi:hypothetical protein
MVQGPVTMEMGGGGFERIRPGMVLRETLPFCWAASAASIPA